MSRHLPWSVLKARINEELRDHQRQWTSSDITLTYQEQGLDKIMTKTVQGLKWTLYCDFALVPAIATQPWGDMYHSGDLTGGLVDSSASHRVYIWYLLPPEEIEKRPQGGLTTVPIGYARNIEEAHAFLLEVGHIISLLARGETVALEAPAEYMLSAYKYHILMAGCVVDYLQENYVPCPQYQDGVIPDDIEFLHEGYDIPEHIADYEAESDWRELV